MPRGARREHFGVTLACAFFVELGAAMIVASTMLPCFNSRPLRQQRVDRPQDVLGRVQERKETWQKWRALGQASDLVGKSGTQRRRDELLAKTSPERRRRARPLRCRGCGCCQAAQLKAASFLVLRRDNGGTEGFCLVPLRLAIAQGLGARPRDGAPNPMYRRDTRAVGSRARPGHGCIHGHWNSERRPCAAGVLRSHVARFLAGPRSLTP